MVGRQNASTRLDQTAEPDSVISVRALSLLPDRNRQFGQPPLDPIRLDIRKVPTVRTRCALVGAALGVGMRQNVVALILSYRA